MKLGLPVGELGRAGVKTIVFCAAVVCLWLFTSLVHVANHDISSRSIQNPKLTYEKRGDQTTGKRTDGVVLNFQQLTADKGLYAHSAFFLDGKIPEINIIVAGIDKYLSLSYSCHVVLKSGETIHVTGSYRAMHMLLNDLRQRSGYISCPVPRVMSPPTSVSLSLEGVEVLPHSLRVQSPTVGAL